METFNDDDKTTTKAPTTTTPTTTVAPDFQCYTCNATSNGNITGEHIGKFPEYEQDRLLKNSFNTKNWTRFPEIDLGN